jgi:eukaryotic-like serine/threonine-protein kinase
MHWGVREEALDETLDEPDEPILGTAGHRFGERFVTDVLIGSGGMGMVLRGRDLLDGSPVALKILHRKACLAVERFTREAEMLAGLRHPAIVRYVAHGRTVAGEPYLAMEWLDGESLADRLVLLTDRG